MILGSVEPKIELSIIRNLFIVKYCNQIQIIHQYIVFFELFFMNFNVYTEYVDWKQFFQ